MIASRREHVYIDKRHDNKRHNHIHWGDMTRKWDLYFFKFAVIISPVDAALGESTFINSQGRLRQLTHLFNTTAARP
ncbi:MAG: hypothetical protein AB2697_22495 [Candidatus Thiodiazotropha endolucinida]